MAAPLTTRRVVLAAGAAVVAAGAGLHLVGLDDDLLRAAGARPHPEPDPADERLLSAATSRQRALLADLDALPGRPAVLARDGAVRRAVAEQLRALGGRPASGPAASPPDSLVDLAGRFAAAAREAERAAVAAAAPELAQVLASLAAGRAQVARTVGRAG